MTIKDVAKKLNENNLLRTNEEIEKFEDALEIIINNDDYKDIKYLCLGFNDNTKDDEVMFGLIHAIESYDDIFDSKLTLKEFLITIPLVLPKAKEWIKTMIIRILNNDKSLNEYIDVAKKCNENLKTTLIELMNEVKKVNAENFSKKINDFLSELERC